MGKARLTKANSIKQRKGCKLEGKALNKPDVGEAKSTKHKLLTTTTK